MTLTYDSDLTALMARARRLLQTTSGASDHWSDADVRDALNEAQIQLEMELLDSFEEMYFTKRLDTLSPVNNIIVLPADFIRSLAFEKLTGSTTWIPVRIVPVAHAYRYTYLGQVYADGSTVPSLYETWTIVGRTLKAVPAQPVSGTYALTYQYRIPDLQIGTDVTEIPAEYQENLVYMATHTLALQAKEREIAAQLQPTLQNLRGYMKQTAARRHLPLRRQILDTQGYSADEGYGAWTYGGL